MKNRSVPEDGKIRLVFLIGELGRGGSERQLYLLLRHLDHDFFDCHVIVFNPSKHFVYNDALKDLGVSVWPVPAICKGILRRVYFIYRLLKRLSPDVVHSWTLHDNPYAGMVGWLARVPLRLGSLRGSLSSPGMRSLPFIYRHLALHSISGLVVNSNAIRKELMADRYRASRVALITNCIEVDDLDNSDTTPIANLSELGINDQDRLIGIVGNLRPEKNHLMFVESMARVLPRFPDAKGLIVGQSIPGYPELSGKIEAAIKKFGVAKQMVMTGFRGDTPSVMRRLNLLCLTSTSEGMPNVILEAMAAGCPIVATNVGGVGELVTNGVNGLLIESGDVNGFSQAVERLLEDPELTRELGAAGRKMVEQRFGCDLAAQKLTRLYCTALQAQCSSQVRIGRYLLDS